MAELLVLQVFGRKVLEILKIRPGDGCRRKVRGSSKTLEQFFSQDMIVGPVLPVVVDITPSGPQLGTMLWHGSNIHLKCDNNTPNLIWSGDVSFMQETRHRCRFCNLINVSNLLVNIVSLSWMALRPQQCPWTLSASATEIPARVQNSASTWHFCWKCEVVYSC